MKFRVIHPQTSNQAQSPVRVVEQTTSRALPLLYPDVISEEGLLRELAQIRDGLFSER